MKTFKLRISVLLFLGWVHMASAQNWSWQTSYYKNDIYFNLLNNGQPTFDLSLGGGGCIDRVRYIPSNYLQLLSPPNNIETDRVIQWCSWSNGIKKTGTSAGDPRYNSNQAGNNKGTFSPTYSVSVQNNGALVDVYSVASLIWQTDLAPYMKSSTPCLTRYELLPGGILKIRRFLRAPEIFLNGKLVSNTNAYLEAWTPFMKSAATFNALALGLDGAGNAYNWYKAGGIPTYPNLAVGNTEGYGVVYQNGYINSRPVAALVYGKKEPGIVNLFSTATYVLNSLEWDRGIGILPGMHINYLPAGAIIEQDFYIVLRQKSDASFVAILKSLAANISGPKIYSPVYPFVGETATIVQKLNSLYKWQGDQSNRTNLLQTLINGKRIGSIEDDLVNISDSPFDVYPNPASDEIYLKVSPDINTAEIMITDLLGKEVYRTEVYGAYESGIDCSAFEKGVYIIRMNSGKETWHKKFIKE